MKQNWRDLHWRCLFFHWRSLLLFSGGDIIAAILSFIVWAPFWFLIAPTAFERPSDLKNYGGMVWPKYFFQPSTTTEVTIIGKILKVSAPEWLNLSPPVVKIVRAGGWRGGTVDETTFTITVPSEVPVGTVGEIVLERAPAWTAVIGEPTKSYPKFWSWFGWFLCTAIMLRTYTAYEHLFLGKGGTKWVMREYQ